MQTIWLASYPKSGNTWMRMLLANLQAQDVPADINDLPVRGQIASARAPFDHLLLIDSGLLTHDEIDALRPRVYEELARQEHGDEDHATGPVSPVRYVKTHDAYTRTSSGEPLLAGARGASGVVLIVRDPRDVAPSLANHNGSSIDDAIAFVNDANNSLNGRDDKLPVQLRQTLLGWSGFHESWLGQQDIPIHMVRYEDLHTDPLGTLRGVLDFAGDPASEEAMRRAVRFARFEQLREQEDANGFREAPGLSAAGRPFFRRGEAGAWRDELTADQVGRIEKTNVRMMMRLGYHPIDQALAGNPEVER